jgi:hypothetical protein
MVGRWVFTAISCALGKLLHGMWAALQATQGIRELESGSAAE